MKSSDTDILVIPGYAGSGPAHWQSRMVAKLSTARLVMQPDWLYSSLGTAIAEVVQAVREATRPVVFVAHSAGSSLVAHAAPSLAQLNVLDRVKGAYLVAPPSPRALLELRGIDPAFAALPRDPLPFPSVLVASSNDPHAALEESADMALTWGSQFTEAGDAGHINEDSGHGPWPEGMMRFAGFLSKL